MEFSSDAYYNGAPQAAAAPLDLQVIRELLI
jgi:hypothetical protein